MKGKENCKSESHVYVFDENQIVSLSNSISVFVKLNFDSSGETLEFGFVLGGILVINIKDLEGMIRTIEQLIADER